MIQSHFEDLRRRKAFLERRQLTVRVMSDETGLSQGTILRVKNATMARVSVTTLETLCRYFAVQSLAELIEYSPDTPELAKGE